VRLPPGRERLATGPSAAGSMPTEKTIGIAEVALLAANAEGPAVGEADRAKAAGFVEAPGARVGLEAP